MKKVTKKAVPDAGVRKAVREALDGAQMRMAGYDGLVDRLAAIESRIQNLALPTIESARLDRMERTMDGLRGAVARLADRCADDGTAGGMTVVGFVNKARNETLKALEEMRGLVRLAATRD